MGQLRRPPTRRVGEGVCREYNGLSALGFGDCPQFLQPHPLQLSDCLLSHHCPALGLPALPLPCDNILLPRLSEPPPLPSPDPHSQDHPVCSSLESAHRLWSIVLLPCTQGNLQLFVL